MQFAAASSRLQSTPPGAADERISAATAAEILGIDRDKMYRLMAKGRIRTHGEPHTFNQLRRGDVEELCDLGEPIPLTEAARILRCSANDVRRLIDAGELRAVAKSKRPVFRHDVERYAENHPPQAGPPSPPPGREGQIRTPEAAKILGRSSSGTRSLAAAGKIPAEQDEDGIYWYVPERLQLVLRARAAAAAVERGELPGGRQAPGAPPPDPRPSL
jgi:hypothetical protein